MQYQITPNMLASGNINPSSFAKLDPSNDEKLVQCGAGDPCLGVTGSGTVDAPGTSGASAYHAKAGDLVTLFGPGSIVEVTVGATNITRGFVASDANGYATNVSGPQATPCAYAFESANANELVRVLVLPPLQAYNTVNTTTVTANTTLTAQQSGMIVFANGADLVITLPPPAAGLKYTVISSASTATLQAGTLGTYLAPNGTEKVIGDGFTAAAGKGAVNSHTTAIQGDSFTVVSDGTNWYCTDHNGTWAVHA